MKKIGFADLYLSEWHANNYPLWIEEACVSSGLDYKLSYAWAEEDISRVDKVTTDEWCKKYGAARCKTLEELCEKSDVIIVLAPSNPEVHLKYAETVLKYGKRTYIDKTFAPDHNTALKIFEIGEKNNTPFFSTSALRYASELDAINVNEHMITFGGGGSLEEYIIHQCEMVIKKLGVGVKSVSAEVVNTHTVLDVSFENGKTAHMTYDPSSAFIVGDGKTTIQVSSPFFKKLISEMLNFFETGILPFDKNETKEVIKLVEMSVNAKNEPGKTIYA